MFWKNVLNVGLKSSTSEQRASGQQSKPHGAKLRETYGMQFVKHDTRYAADCRPEYRHGKTADSDKIKQRHSEFLLKTRL